MSLFGRGSLPKSIDQNSAELVVRRMNQAGLIAPWYKTDQQVNVLKVSVGKGIHSRSDIRSSIVALFWNDLAERFKATLGDQSLGLIGLSPGIGPVVAGLSDRLSANVRASGKSGKSLPAYPIVASDTRFDNQGRAHLDPYVDKASASRFAIVDDIVKKGDAIMKALDLWADHLFYPVSHVVVFTDSGEGGRAYVEQEVARINENRRKSAKTKGQNSDLVESLTFSVLVSHEELLTYSRK